ncbi:hypothetical protein V6N12_040906 [Hibiscus sabdariffa]|uniref:RNase H type-1 domain-containing protein n=1 Tax=Hibiscus sabdariffa TaxID=183260 RepID=A0ABR2E522_9ROSI
MTDEGNWDIQRLSALFPEWIVSHILAIKCPSPIDGNDQCGLMTHAERCRRNLSVNPYCLECSNPLETALHTLRDCPAARNLWMYFLPNLSDSALISRSLAWAKHYFDSAVLNTTSPSVSRSVWIPEAIPGSGWICLNVDGAVSVPSHEGRIGGLIRSSAGDWIVGFAKEIGRSDALQAELWAIFEGMSLAWEYGFVRLLIRSDSKQAVELVNSPIVGSSGLSLVRAIYRLRQQNWITEVKWISRVENHSADAVAKFVNPSDFSLHIYATPSLELDSLMRADNCQL